MTASIIKNPVLSEKFHIPQSKIDLFLDQAASKGGAITGLLVMVSSLIISFSTMRHTAQEYGFGLSLSLLWALLIDGIILSQSLVVLRRERLRFPTGFNWFLLISFEAASLFINGAAGWALGHSIEKQIIGALVHGLPPLALFLVAKSMAQDIKDNAKLNNAVFDWHEAQQEITILTAQHKKLTTQNETLSQSVNELKTEKKQLLGSSNGADRFISPLNGASLQKASETKQKQIEARLTRYAEFDLETMNHGDIAQALDVSISTVKRDLKIIQQQNEGGA